MCEQKTGIEIVANPRYQRSLLGKCQILLKTDIFQPKPFLRQFQIELLEVLKSVFLHRSNLSIFGLKSSSDDSKLQKVESGFVKQHFADLSLFTFACRCGPMSMVVVIPIVVVMPMVVVIPIVLLCQW